MCEENCFITFSYMDRVIEVTGTQSVISSPIFPPVILDDEKNYVIGLLSFTTYNTIPNIQQGCNTLHYKDHGGIDKSVTLPTGAYELSDINRYLQKKLGRQNINIVANNNTLRSEIISTFKLDFTKKNTLASLLGFKSKVLPENVSNISDTSVKILQVTSLNIDTNISSGSYKNGKIDHCIHQVIPRVPPGYKIIDTPSTVVYLPVNQRVLDKIVFRITDQTGNIVNFQGESITIRIHLKRGNYGN